MCRLLRSIHYSEIRQQVRSTVQAPPHTRFFNPFVALMIDSIKDIQGATEAQWESEAKSEAARITKERDRAAGAAL